MVRGYSVRFSPAASVCDASDEEAAEGSGSEAEDGLAEAELSEDGFEEAEEAPPQADSVPNSKADAVRTARIFSVLSFLFSSLDFPAIKELPQKEEPERAARPGRTLCLGKLSFCRPHKTKKMPAFQKGASEQHKQT